MTTGETVENRPARSAAAPATAGSSLREQVSSMNAGQRYEKLKGMLHSRGTSVKELSLLATKSEKNWPHVSQVLRGIRGGKKTWARLVDFLTVDELMVLGKEDLVVVKPVESS